MTPLSRLRSALDEPCNGIGAGWCDNHDGEWPGRLGHCEAYHDLAALLAVVDAARGATDKYEDGEWYEGLVDLIDLRDALEKVTG